MQSKGLSFPLQGISPADNVHYHLLCNFDYLAPGFWYSLHLMATRAVNPTETVKFALFTKSLFASVLDIRLRLSLLSYLDNYPPSIFPTVDSKGRKVGMLCWSWSLHHSLESRLPNLETLYDFLSGTGICTTC